MINETMIMANKMISSENKNGWAPFFAAYAILCISNEFVYVGGMGWVQASVDVEVENKKGSLRHS